MEKNNNQFHLESVDTAIDQLLQIDDQDEITTRPNARFVHEISSLYLEESRVLDRAWKRLSLHIQQAKQTNSTQEPISIQRHQARRGNRHMIDQTLTDNDHTQKGRVKRLTRVGSSLVAALLIASVVLAFITYHQSRTANVAHHQSQTTQTATHKTPTAGSVPGPAAPYISSAALATQIKANNQPVVSTSTIKPGQKFWLTFTVQPAPNTSGQVTVKWYLGNALTRQQHTSTIQYLPAGVYNVAMQTLFTESTSGKVEIYWQNKLARTLYFTVK